MVLLVGKITSWKSKIPSHTAFQFLHFCKTHPSCVEALKYTRRTILPHSRASVYKVTHSFSTVFVYMCCHKYMLCFPLPCAANFSPRLLSPADAHIQATPGDRSWTVFGHRGRRLSAGERAGVSCLGSAGRRRRSEIKL